jgi:hypothetical protein
VNDKPEDPFATRYGTAAKVAVGFFVLGISIDVFGVSCLLDVSHQQSMGGFADLMATLLLGGTAGAVGGCGWLVARRDARRPDGFGAGARRVGRLCALAAGVGLFEVLVVFAR